MTVKEASRFLGVSPQTVYLWVERKQIPHFRVMGRNIRFLKSDLKPFRAQFKQEVEDGKAAESTNTVDWSEAQRQLRERLDTRDNNSLETLPKGKQLTFNEWVDIFLLNYSKPPIRAAKTHEANENALKILRPVFGCSKPLDIDGTQIEFHLRMRLQQKRRVRRKSGIFELGTLKATSVHQEFRVLRRIFSVAVKRNSFQLIRTLRLSFPSWSKVCSGHIT
jgi:excisionase family DNA binding protein